MTAGKLLPIALLVTGGVTLGAILFGGDWHGSSPTRSTIKAAYVIDGKMLLADEEYSDNADHGHVEYHALSLLDLATGARLARVKIPFQEELIAVTPAGLWLADHTELGLHRRNATTLAVEVTQVKWAGKMKVSSVTGVENGRAQVLDDQGRAWWLDLTTLEVRTADIKPDLPEPVSLEDEPTMTGEAYFRDAGGTQRLASWVGTYPRAGLRCGKTATVSPDTLLDPKFLRTVDGAHGIWLTQPDSALAIFPSSTDSNATLQLARVPCAGPPLWTAALPGDDLDDVALGADAITLIVGTIDGDTAIQIALADGTVRWTHAY